MCGAGALIRILGYVIRALHLQSGTPRNNVRSDSGSYVASKRGPSVPVIPSPRHVTSLSICICVLLLMSTPKFYESDYKRTNLPDPVSPDYLHRHEKYKL